jgi:glycosyltransferase involved in cell wall biosynthesis
MLEPWALAHKKWKKRIAWLVYQRGMLQSAACLHATSDREAENLRNMGLRSAVVTIPWGIEVEDENGGMQTGGRYLRNVIGNPAKGSLIQDSRRTALFVGRLYPVKGLPLLLQAWARVRPSGWKLRLVGPDEDGHQIELEALVGKFGLSEVVEFTGSLEREALASAYRDSELFVLPSYTENFGMVVGEAMACGLPVIASQGTPWQILEREKCGWWAPVSADGIAAALADATMRSSEELLAIGARGRKVVTEQFCWDKIARDFISCYERALGSQEKPSYI